MPPDRFVLMLVGVIAAAGLTVWIGATVANNVQLPALGWLGFVPAALIVYVLWRVISDRISNAKDDTHGANDK